MNKKEIGKSLDRIYGWLIEVEREDTVENPFLVTALGFAMAEVKELIKSVEAE